MKIPGAVPVASLPLEEQAEVVERMAASDRAWRAAHGLVPVPPLRDPSRSWCGHPATSIVVDEAGVAICRECGEE